jgi:hypothetical protein
LAMLVQLLTMLDLQWQQLEFVLYVKERTV